MLRGWAEHGVRAELEEVAGRGELVMVGVRIAGVDAHSGRRGDGRAYSVVTVRDGRIVACATVAIGRRPWTPPASGSGATSSTLNLTQPQRHGWFDRNQMGAVPPGETVCCWIPGEAG